MRLFVDMDGVLADFDAHYEQHFGVRIQRDGPEPPDLWENIKTRPQWFDELPVLPGALDFWSAMLPYEPTILSGVNYIEMPDSVLHKRAWVDRHLGPEVPLITCRSSEKRNYGKPGDILVDDWPKYRKRWEKMGGTFILHDYRNPDASIEAVVRLLNGR